MSEMFQGVEGDWVRESPSSAQWNKGFWRKVDHKEYHYLNGQSHDLIHNMGRAYDSDNALVERDYWERFVPVVKVPTEPGIYRDKDGDLWTLDKEHDWWTLVDSNEWVFSSSADVDEYKPFEFVTNLKEEK